MDFLLDDPGQNAAVRGIRPEKTDLHGLLQGAVEDAVDVLDGLGADGFYSLVNPETFDVSHFHVRILFAELFLEHFADLAAGFALLFHALDGLIGSR